VKKTIAAAVAALVVGILLGGHNGWMPGFVRGVAVGDGDTRVVRQAIDTIHDRYYREIPRDQLADTAIAGMVDSLKDQFSHYFTAKEYRAFEQEQSSSYEGIGVTVGDDKRGPRVVTVYDGSPAKRAGIEAGDIIVSANGVSLAGKKTDAASRLIKGPPGTAVKLGILHDGKTRVESVSRARVTVPVVASAMKSEAGKKIGVVELATFNTTTAHGEVVAALQKLKKQGAKGYVLDLRANGGGLVSEAQLIASAFLKDGPIVTTKGRSLPTRTLSAIGDPVLPDEPLVVLVDRNTASASEIVAGALQDRKRAELVGTRTFGKGIFQEVLTLSNGGALDITAGQYFTPAGRNLGGGGVKPGAGLQPQVKAQDDPKTARDEAMPVALRTVAAEIR